MTQSETKQTAFKLLGRACLHGFISVDSFSKSVLSEVKTANENEIGQKGFFLERLSWFRLKMTCPRVC